MGEEFHNDLLQRGILRAFAERAMFEGKWIRLKAKPDVQFRPSQFILLLEQGHWMKTLPSDWEAFRPLSPKPVKTEESGPVEAPAPAPPPRQPKEKKPVSTTTTTNTPADRPKILATPERLYQRLERRQAITEKYQTEMAELQQEINELARALGIGQGQPAVAAKPAAAPTTTTLPPRMHRRKKAHAKGIRVAILRQLTRNGGTRTGVQIQSALLGNFTPDQVAKNLYPMVAEGILTLDKTTGQYTLGARWANTHAGRQVQMTEGSH